MTVTATNLHDVTQATKLIQNGHEVAHRNFSYLGKQNRRKVISEEHLSNNDYRINRCPKTLRFEDLGKAGLENRRGTQKNQMPQKNCKPRRLILSALCINCIGSSWISLLNSWAEIKRRNVSHK